MLDVVAPMTAAPIARSEALLVAMAAPVALAVWALLSAFWSDSPARTPQQAMLMSLVILTAMWFGYALTFRQQVWSLFIGLHVLSLGSFVVAVLLESARIGPDEAVGRLVRRSQHARARSPRWASSWRSGRGC